MRKVVLCTIDIELFGKDLTVESYLFLERHKDAFRQMWKEQGKDFWIRLSLTFRSHSKFYGYIRSLPSKNIKYRRLQENVDWFFINIHEEFIDGSFSRAKQFMNDVVTITSTFDSVSYQNFSSYGKDPFYRTETRDIYRRFFGNPIERSSYAKVFMLYPLYLKFAGTICECLRRWLVAPEMEPGDMSYWVESKVTEEEEVDGDELVSRNDTEQSDANNGDGKVASKCVCGNLTMMTKTDGLFTGWPVNQDPRFYDPANPLFNPLADPSEDWRDDLSIDRFVDFVDYILKNFAVRKRKQMQEEKKKGAAVKEGAVEKDGAMKKEEVMEKEGAMEKGAMENVEGSEERTHGTAVESTKIDAAKCNGSACNSAKSANCAESKSPLEDFDSEAKLQFFKMMIDTTYVKCRLEQQEIYKKITEPSSGLKTKSKKMKKKDQKNLAIACGPKKELNGKDRLSTKFDSSETNAAALKKDMNNKSDAAIVKENKDLDLLARSIENAMDRMKPENVDSEQLKSGSDPAFNLLKSVHCRRDIESLKDLSIKPRMSEVNHHAPSSPVVVMPSKIELFAKKEEVNKSEENVQEFCKSCSGCGKIEPAPRTFKICKRCKSEMTKNAMFYCGRECQVSDWIIRHRQDHPSDKAKQSKSLSKKGQATSINA